MTSEAEMKFIIRQLSAVRTATIHKGFTPEFFVYFSKMSVTSSFRMGRAVFDQLCVLRTSDKVMILKLSGFMDVEIT